MMSSRLFVDYLIPPTFQYPLRKETIIEKIYKIGNKILTFIRQNQVAVAVSLSSFLICKTIASSLDSVSILSTTVDNLDDCQERLCNYWNDNIHRNESNSRVKVNNLLSSLSYRCNTSDSHYKPFKSFNKCKKVWCEYANIMGGNLTNCFDSPKRFIRLWNRLCSKAEFNRLKTHQKKKFFNQCFKKICNYYKNHNEQVNFNYYCQSLRLNRIMQRVYKLLKHWQSESLKTQSYDSGNTESALSITASVIGVVAGIGSIVGTGLACFVAKVTLDSLRPLEVPAGITGVGEGLRNIVTGSIAFARRATLGHLDHLNIPNEREMSRISSQDREMSRVSSQVDTLYQDAQSSISGMEEDIREITFNFFDNEQENLLQSNVIEESDIVNQHFLENPVPDEAVIPYDNSFFTQNFGQAIEGAGQMVQKVFTKLGSLIPDYREIIYMTRSENTQSFEILFDSLDSILSNATKKAIQVAGAIIEPGINGSFRINGSEKIYEYNLTYTVDYSLNYTLLNQSTIANNNNDYAFYKAYRIFGKIVKWRTD